MPLEGAHTLSTFGTAGTVLRCGSPLFHQVYSRTVEISGPHRGVTIPQGLIIKNGAMTVKKEVSLAHTHFDDGKVNETPVMNQIKSFLLVYGAVKTTIKDQEVVWVYGKGH